MTAALDDDFTANRGSWAAATALTSALKCFATVLREDGMKRYAAPLLGIPTTFADAAGRCLEPEPKIMTASTCSGAYAFVA